MSSSIITEPLTVNNTNESLINSTIEFVVDYESDFNVYEYLDYTQISFVCGIFIALYIIVILFAVTGNALVIFTVLTNRKMQTVVNYYIVNLAICDFLVGFFVAPIKLLELTAPAHWGALTDDLCTALLYLQTVIVFTSVLTLVAICFERYFAVVHPLRSRAHQSKTRTVKILHFVWCVSIIVASPFLMPSEADLTTLTSELGTIDRLSCFTKFPADFRISYYSFLFVCFYLIPLMLIGWSCYKIAQCLIKQTILQREGLLRRQEVNRRKVAKMILVVVFAFTISWTPYFLVTIITQYQEVNFLSKHNFYFTMLCINLFAFLNSSINPFIYVLMSTRFRLGFSSILRVLLCISHHELDNESDTIVSNGSQMSKPMAYLTKYRRRMVMFACGETTQLSTDSGPSEASPQFSAFGKHGQLVNGQSCSGRSTNCPGIDFRPDSSSTDLKSFMVSGKHNSSHVTRSLDSLNWLSSVTVNGKQSGVAVGTSSLVADDSISDHCCLTLKPCSLINDSSVKSDLVNQNCDLNSNVPIRRLSENLLENVVARLINRQVNNCPQENKEKLYFMVINSASSSSSSHPSASSSSTQPPSYNQHHQSSSSKVNNNKSNNLPVISSLTNFVNYKNHFAYNRSKSEPYFVTSTTL